MEDEAVLSLTGKRVEIYITRYSVNHANTIKIRGTVKTALHLNSGILVELANVQQTPFHTGSEFHESTDRGINLSSPAVSDWIVLD